MTAKTTQPTTAAFVRWNSHPLSYELHITHDHFVEPSALMADLFTVGFVDKTKFGPKAGSLVQVRRLDKEGSGHLGSWSGNDGDVFLNTVNDILHIHGLAPISFPAKD